MKSPLKKDLMVCAKCKEKSPSLFGISFNELVGEPMICSRCAYTAIMGKEAPPFKEEPK